MNARKNTSDNHAIIVKRDIISSCKPNFNLALYRLLPAYILLSIRNRNRNRNRKRKPPGPPTLRGLSAGGFLLGLGLHTPASYVQYQKMYIT